MKPSTNNKPASSWVLPLVVMLIASLSSAPLLADESTLTPPPQADTVVVVYQGLLQDETGAPISGVLGLTFHLYRSGMSATAMWSETHFVSVVDGRYQVALGEKQPLLDSFLSGERWIGIELFAEGEILRDPISVERPDNQQTSSAQGRITHADRAERAGEAERARLADNALALDGMTAEEIERMANLALQRLGEHIADPHAHSASARYRIGSDRRVMERVGGRGGTPFDVRCPAGYVVTGIEGSAGRLLDSITVVCSPLN